MEVQSSGNKENGYYIISYHNHIMFFDAILSVVSDVYFPFWKIIIS